MNILFLCQRIPFPPDKGDKIRAFNMLAHLARHHRIHLGAFVDEPGDMRHAHQLREMLDGECMFVPLGTMARGRMMNAFVQDASLTTSYFKSSRLDRWVDNIIRHHNIARAFVFGTAMAPYLLARNDFDHAHVIFDMVDVDSEKWRQYAEAAPGFRSWIFRREARTLFALERRAAAAFGATLLVSPAEMDVFARQAPETRVRLLSVANGVDLTYFSPKRDYQNLFETNEIPIVMTGTMDYRPNAEGAAWFAQSVLPLIRAVLPQTRFHIVGARPTAKVKSLCASDVVVTGRVEDVRPYLAHARAVVAPLKLARGVQNKVLEGLAMCKPVIATSPAARALDVIPGKEMWIEDEPVRFAQAVIAALSGGDHAAVALNGRRYVERNHDWAHNLAVLDRLLEVDLCLRTHGTSLNNDALPLAKVAE